MDFEKIKTTVIGKKKFWIVVGVIIVIAIVANWIQ